MVPVTGDYTEQDSLCANFIHDIRLAPELNLHLVSFVCSCSLAMHSITKSAAPILWCVYQINNTLSCSLTHSECL